MKKLIAILLVVVMALSLVACSAKKKIVGSWEYKDSKVNGHVLEYFIFEEYRFNAGGTFIADNEVPGTYKIQGNKLMLRITYDGGESYEQGTFKLTFSGDTMTWSNELGSITFSRVK